MSTAPSIITSEDSQAIGTMSQKYLLRIFWRKESFMSGKFSDSQGMDNNVNTSCKEFVMKFFIVLTAFLLPSHFIAIVSPETSNVIVKFGSLLQPGKFSSR
mmetsp:Transcript_20514/g.23242  ORF Transcript_20514/g.23242 Transcript_20514/m.23242 type:complete len:101 (+) Transcript_20514:545-847(+)